ncbi:MAG TPA: MBL fold metallo-hydrolase [Bryobacteraceae bacterium]|nr:MBL fold metallo-hydrolase [Bryobacteraceae bacterium]
MHNHAHSHDSKASRRDFFRTMVHGTLAGASILELAHHRAAWGRAMAPGSSAQLFDIQKAAEGVYFAQAHAQAQINSNSAIFVNANDVLVVDSHSKPSAAASLIAQIKKEVTTKPVRYVVNSHFHWDHTQGNHAYRVGEKKIDFIASAPTKRLMSELAETRLKDSLDNVPKQIDALRTRASKSTSPGEKAFCEGQIQQLKAYQAELQNYTLELPTITFDKSYVIRDKAHDLHLEFRGHAHTAGDIVTFCPQKRIVSTGDAVHGIPPFIADGFPKSWPKTIDSIAELGFDRVIPGHGPLHTSRQPMTGMRNYIEELTERVDAGRKAGKSVSEMQESITVASLKSMQSNGYSQFLMANRLLTSPVFGPLSPLQLGVNTNIGDVYKNLDRT